MPSIGTGGTTPRAIAIDTQIKASLKARGIGAASFSGQLLHEPTQIKTGAGGPFKVYTPFWRAFCAQPEPRRPFPAPDGLTGYAGKVRSDALSDWALLPEHPDWAAGFADEWQPGEAGAAQKLAKFLDSGIKGYADGRNVPGIPSTSQLSPHLAMGEITPFQVWEATRHIESHTDPRDVEVFRKEVVWREFAYHLLFHFLPCGQKTSIRTLIPSPGAPRRNMLKHGSAGRPAIRLSMRGCASSGKPDGCTTGCG